INWKKIAEVGGKILSSL
uniref:Dominulin-A n=1 Tax=Polistes dominula TaxID=743375 RepID=MASTA_POLDO|nr:RecName: Full=Dominulin-A [Polistes dominula]